MCVYVCVSVPCTCMYVYVCLHVYMYIANIDGCLYVMGIYSLQVCVSLDVCICVVCLCVCV